MYYIELLYKRIHNIPSYIVILEFHQSFPENETNAGVEEAVLHWLGNSVKAVKHRQLATLIYIYSFDLLMTIGPAAIWSAWPVRKALVHQKFWSRTKIFKNFDPTQTNIFEKIGPVLKKLVCPVFSAIFMFY